MTRPFLDSGEVAKFWNTTRKQAEEDQQSGYLQDEWPTALGMHRFHAEWALLTRWLDQHDVARGACLDVGCGVGLWLEHLAGVFERADGIDLSEEMVASAQRRMERLGIDNTRVACRSVSDLPEDQQYDLIFVGGVLMYLNDDQVAPIVTRMARLLRPGGLLVLRESTAMPEPWYRDKPLQPGLFADPAAPRPPYYCIYRTPRFYRDLCIAQGLRVCWWGRNRAYKLADITETWLRLLDRVSGRRLGRDRARAERAAERIHRLRALTLLPAYYAARPLARWLWRINNHWYVCTPAPALPEPAARSS